MEFTPEPISMIISAAAALVVAFGGRAMKKGYESGKSESPEDKLSKALWEMVEQFRQNNALFLGLGGKVDQLTSLTKDLERTSAEQLQVMRSMREDELKKGGRR